MSMADPLDVVNLARFYVVISISWRMSFHTKCIWLSLKRGVTCVDYPKVEVEFGGRPITRNLYDLSLREGSYTDIIPGKSYRLSVDPVVLFVVPAKFSMRRTTERKPFRQ